MFFLKEFLLPFLPSILTILGWWIVASRDGKSKKNAIHNRRVEIASKLIEKILNDSKQFYSLSGADNDAKGLSSIITSDFKKLSTIIKLITDELSENEKISLFNIFLEYKKIVTGGQFETISRLAIPSTNQLNIDIDATYNDFYIELEQVYLI